MPNNDQGEQAGDPASVAELHRNRGMGLTMTSSEAMSFDDDVRTKIVRLAVQVAGDLLSTAFMDQPVGWHVVMFIDVDCLAKPSKVGPFLVRHMSPEQIREREGERADEVLEVFALMGKAGVRVVLFVVQDADEAYSWVCRIPSKESNHRGESRHAG